MAEFKEYRRPKARKGPKRVGRIDLESTVYKQLRRHVPADAIRLERLRAQWPALVTPRIARRTWPQALQRGRLTVHVHDNQWLHELGYLRQAILQRLQELVASTEVREIELRLGAVPERVEPPAPERPAPFPAPLSRELPSETVEAIDRVSDPELRAAILAAREAFGRPGGT